MYTDMRLGLIAIALVGGCAIFSPIPDLRTPSDRARELAPKCSLLPSGESGAALARTLVESVEPDYVFMYSGPVDRQPRLRGARLHLRPTAGVSRESLQRSLECHQARALLGQTGVLADDDPFVLPDVWLDITADSAGDGFVVFVRTDSLPDARRVLERARRFAAKGS
jgi:hypothetical protein